jgi:hypothetical protein
MEVSIKEEVEKLIIAQLGKRISGTRNFGLLRDRTIEKPFGGFSSPQN